MSATSKSDGRRQAQLRSLILVICLLVFNNPTVKAQRDSVSECGHSSVGDLYGPDFAAQAESFLRELQEVVRANDSRRFSTLIRYPLSYAVGSDRRQIKNSADFIRKYRSIVTPELKKAILKQTSKCLFANGDGVMIGRGELWFQQQKAGQMKVITITLNSF